MMYSFFSAYHFAFKMNPYQRELPWRTIVAVTRICYAGIECFEYIILARVLYVSDRLLFFISFPYPPFSISSTWLSINRRVPHDHGELLVITKWNFVCV